MTDQCLIYIPTKGRTDKQITYNTLPRELQARVWFVVCSEEAEFFKRLHGSQVLVCDTPGVAAARQAAVEHGLAQNIFFLDDDLRFSCRVEDWMPELPQMRKMTDADIIAAFEWADEKFKAYAQVGFLARGNNQGLPNRYERVATRMMRSFGVDCSVLTFEGIRFDRFKYWEDFHVTLALLKIGYPNIGSAVYCSDGVTNAAGGVSLYRKVEDLLRVREEFLAEHAPFVKANDKSAKNWGSGLGGEGATMPDMIISWRKAYNGPIPDDC